MKTQNDDIRAPCQFFAGRDDRLCLDQRDITIENDHVVVAFLNRISCRQNSMGSAVSVRPASELSHLHCAPAPRRRPVATGSLPRPHNRYFPPLGQHPEHDKPLADRPQRGETLGRDELMRLPSPAARMIVKQDRVEISTIGSS